MKMSAVEALKEIIVVIKSNKTSVTKVNEISDITVERFPELWSEDD